MAQNLIIIDSNSLLHRSFHALPPLTAKDGQPTGAVYGFLLTLFKAVKELNANCVIACFDTKAPTFRHEVFKQYKIHRPETPREIISQIDLMKEVLNILKIPIFHRDGFEADDLIATIASKARDKANVFIVSGDLDNLQLVDEKIKVYTLGKGIKDSILYDESKVFERFGVKPSQMNDFKALTGDASDNIPGVKGIGKKTAAELIQKFESIKNLYQEISTDTAVLKPKIKESLKNNKESAFLSLSLVETKKDIPIDFDINKCKFPDFDQSKAKDFFSKLGFNSLIEKLSQIASS